MRDLFIKAYSLLNPESETDNEERLLAILRAGFRSVCLNRGYAAG